MPVKVSDVSTNQNQLGKSADICRCCRYENSMMHRNLIFVSNIIGFS